MSSQHDLALALALGATIPEPPQAKVNQQAQTSAPTARRPSTTRNGKIARLPRAIREELNQRLEDGAQGKALVTWLNTLPEVRTVMKESFGGRAVTEQNLSEWRQGGFLDWQRQQDALAWVRQAEEETQELEQEAGPAPLTDVLGASITLLLSRLIRGMGENLESSSEQRQDLILLIRQWCALRSGDHRAAKLKMQQQDWTTRRERAEESRRRWETPQAAAAQVESGAVKVERLNPHLQPKLSVPQFPLQGCFASSTTHSQPNRSNPTESDRIAPKKSAKGGKALAHQEKRR